MKTRYELIVALSVILVVFVNILSCLGTPGIGDIVHKGVWEVKIVSVRNETTLRSLSGPLQYEEKTFGGQKIKFPKRLSWSAQEGYTYLVIEVLINNTSKETQDCSSSSFSLTDSKERIYVPVGIGPSSLNYELCEGWTISMTGPGRISDKSPSYIVFLVPDNASGFRFKFLDLLAIELGR